jgi:hypothetical protein
MAINYDSRPSGVSKREYAASILGGSKENYDSSGNKKSSSSSSSKSSSSNSSVYKPVTYKSSDFVNTKPVAQAYDSAKTVFTDQLTALKPRYEELYKQLQASQDLTAQKEAQQFGQESTQQKVDLAKRGVSTDTSNSFYNTEAGKLTQQQNIQSKETALDYAGKRLDVSGAESADTRDISTSIANLDLTKANTIANMLTDAKKTAATLNSSELDRAMTDKIAQRTYELTKSEGAANRAQELYKLAKSESSSKNNAYNTSLSALVSDAYSKNDPAEYTREKIAKQMEAAFPAMAGQVKNDISKFFPDGWEAQAGNGTGVTKEGDGETYIKY